MMRHAFFALTLAIPAAGCGDEPAPAAQKADPEEIANFLAERDPPDAAPIERQIDIEQSGSFIEKAPLERSEDVARELAER